VQLKAIKCLRLTEALGQARHRNRIFHVLEATVASRSCESSNCRS
jgi:hypothetical protein